MLGGIVCLKVEAQQQFNSGSDGTDGALNITAPGVTYLDPVAMKLHPKFGNIFNFTTITIAKGSALKLSELKFHGGVFFLAQGDVVINGAIDLTGDDSPGSAQKRVWNSPDQAGIRAVWEGFTAIPATKLCRATGPEAEYQEISTGPGWCRQQVYRESLSSTSGRGVGGRGNGR